MDWGLLIGLPFGIFLVLGRLVSEEQIWELWSSFGTLAKYTVAFCGAMFLWIQIATCLLHWGMKKKLPDFKILFLEKILGISLFALVFYSVAQMLIFTAALTYVLYQSAGIVEGYKRAMLSVPLSQIANVVYYAPEGLTSEEEESINKFIPDIQLYERKFADPIKYTFNEEEYSANSSEFWELWIQLLLKNPVHYLDAFLALNAPLWYMEDDSVVPYISVGIFSRHYSYEWNNQIPGLHSVYMKMAEYEQGEKGVYRLPGIRQFFNISTSIWILWSAFVLLIMKKRLRDSISLVPLILIWFTYLLGPVSNFRYILPIFISYPIILIVLLKKSDALLELKERKE